MLSNGTDNRNHVTTYLWRNVVASFVPFGFFSVQASSVANKESSSDSSGALQALRHLSRRESRVENTSAYEKGTNES